jgi:hypothetical protein
MACQMVSSWWRLRIEPGDSAHQISPQPGYAGDTDYTYIKTTVEKLKTDGVEWIFIDEEC